MCPRNQGRTQRLHSIGLPKEPFEKQNRALSKEFDTCPRRGATPYRCARFAGPRALPELPPSNGSVAFFVWTAAVALATPPRSSLRRIRRIPRFGFPSFVSREPTRVLRQASWGLHRRRRAVPRVSKTRFAWNSCRSPHAVLQDTSGTIPHMPMRSRRATRHSLYSCEQLMRKSAIINHPRDVSSSLRICTAGAAARISIEIHGVRDSRRIS